MKVPEEVIFALLAAVSIGLMNIFIQKLLHEVDSSGLKLEQFLPLAAIMAIALIATYFLYYQSLPAKVLELALISGVFALGTFAFTSLALSKGKVSNAAALFNLNVLVVLVVSALFFGEKISAKDLMGIVITTLGVSLLAL